LRRKVILEYPIRVLSEFDDDEYDVVGCVDGVERETEKAVQLRVPSWGDAVVWFPRYLLRLEDDIIYAERRIYKEKKRDHCDR
jgi:hypothetical protein